MTEERIKVEVKGAIASITLARPEVRNAFDGETVEQLTKALEDLRKIEPLHALMIGGAGDHFCAGGDLSWMRIAADYSPEENRKDFQRIHEMLEKLYRFPCATIARVQGAALGGGSGLIAAVDMAVAEGNAFFSLSEARWGMIPAVLSPFVMRKLGMAAYRAYGLSAKRFNAEEALRIGLVQEVVPMEELDAAVQRWIDLLLDNGPQAMRDIKVTSEQVLMAKDLESASHITIPANAKSRTSSEGQEGIRAFLEKRIPRWRSKR